MPVPMGSVFADCTATGFIRKTSAIIIGTGSRGSDSEALATLSRGRPLLAWRHPVNDSGWSLAASESARIGKGVQYVPEQRKPIENAADQVGRAGRSSKLVWAAAALVALLLVIFGPGALGKWARHRAIADMDAWAISDALRWLDRAESVYPGHPELSLLRATCYRHLGQMQPRAEMLDQARTNGAAEQDILNEVTLGQIKSGQLSEGAEAKLGELTQSRMSPGDTASAFIEGCISQQNMERADSLLRAWQADFPGEPHIHYVRGIMWLRSGNKERSREEFEETLARQPRHELARIALAELYEEGIQFEQALDIYTRLARKNPRNENVLVGLARVLRKQGRIEQARTALAPAVSQPEPSSELTVEAAEIELELGNYETARGWFDKTPGKDMVNHTTLTSAAITLAMLGQTVAAEKANQWIIDEVTAVTAIHDLQTRMQVNPADSEAAGEFQQLVQKLGRMSADENPWESATSSSPSMDSDKSAGMQLYEQHCVACHGTEGRGDGRAARYLFPRPRNLRNERMRLVSTGVGIPTTGDIKAIIRNGIPGTAMAALETLQDAELEQLADVVGQMRREGVREDYVAFVLADDDEVDPEDVAQVVAVQTQPRDVIVPPPIPAADEASLALGKQLYGKLTCDSCHGIAGAGDHSTPLFDDSGSPAFARDLIRDHFKGGNTSESIYLRLRAGMPGSPHPANEGLSDQELIALVHYCQSLGEEPKAALTNHQRALRTTSRPAWEISDSGE